MKLEITLGFSHVRDSVLAMYEKFEAMPAEDHRRISLKHLCDSLMAALPDVMREQVEDLAERARQARIRAESRKKK